MPTRSAVLSKITVIDMTEGVAGPYAAMVLSGMGANVIKVEREAGDWSRPTDCARVEGASNANFIALNRNKRGLGLDLSRSTGKEIPRRLIARSDVLISNYRPGVMAKLGFDHASSRAINEDLTNALRVENRAALDEVIVPIFATEPAHYWLERLRAADILCGPINSFADIAADTGPSSVLPLVDPLNPDVPMTVGVPFRLNGHYATTTRAAPAKGEHTSEILLEFGFSTDEIEACLRDGAVFSSPL
jgi:crotonobetainyl-CoA:carnitine CoA-transferase CaiB-like acyl-CoA transferase